MRRVLLLAAISGFLTVAIGAFAAHGLRAVLDARQLGWIDTGLRGQGWHTLVLLAIAILMASKPSPLLHTAAAAFALGILLFSGGLYALALVAHAALVFYLIARGELTASKRDLATSVSIGFVALLPGLGSEAAWPVLT